MNDINDDNKCFVCGTGNQQGLKLKFNFDQQSKIAGTEFSFPSFLQGWAGRVHGGLISTVLDEVMVKAAGYNNYKCVTAEINVKFKKPVLTGAIYKAAGNIDQVKKRIVFSSGKLIDSEGVLVATASAKLFIVA